MIKPNNWETLLFDYLDRCSIKEMVWGEFDCCTFACDWAMLLGHADPMSSLRGRYDSAASAVKLLIREGDGTIESVTSLCDENGSKYERISSGFCSRGDVVLVKGVRFEGTMESCLGICVGREVALVSNQGLVYTDRKSIQYGWRL